jgi:DNA-binding transcriptional regulator GbsR (MarR family)
MASKLFEPKGEAPIWQPLYEHCRELDYGTLVTYEQLNEILDRDSRENRGPIYDAMREMERHDHRTFKCVPRVGYAIAEPDEHRALAEKHRKRSYRQVKKARNKITSAPRELLSEDDRRWMDETEIRLSQLESGLRHANRRLALVERKVESKSTNEAEILEALEKLRQRGLI